MLLSMSIDIVFDSHVVSDFIVDFVCVFVFVVLVEFTCTFTCTCTWYVYLLRVTFTFMFYDSVHLDVLIFDSTSCVLGRLRVTIYVFGCATRRRSVEA